MNQVVKGSNYRITILTDRLLRLEYQQDGRFEDRLTKTVVSRNFPSVPFDSRRENNLLLVETDKLKLCYDEKVFSPNGLSIELKEFGTTWHYSVVYGNSDRNLLGTARTLDNKDGWTELEPGIFGLNGYAVLDDSLNPVYTGKDYDDGSGEFVNRQDDGFDLYFFGYGSDFYGGLKAFYTLCGKTPMIPRYALGNWWSRYYRYSEESYKEVIDRFEEMGIPLSVAVIDMDWHITDVDPKYGTGWTGYTWNKDLFPDPKRFLKMLKDRGLAVTLNLHPADGIRAFEEMYPQVAARMGLDPDEEKAVEFDFGDSRFRKTYFEEVMHPYERDGVDFWWIDWQQGTGNKAGDVDPLFLLNHYHYKDQEGRNVRPMIFSRYAGPGSHRYPVGFSGDTISSWKSLKFQPQFTSTASNIGYGWWSHDIGGHMLGDKNHERLIRWIQYGVFSPIMRLHSSSSPFLNKEPWVIPEPYRSIMTKYMRLRHRLLPYLYTETYRAYLSDKPLIRPMYYDHPDDEKSYQVPCEYGFGDCLIVASMGDPMDEKLKVSSVSAYIPDGRWYDLFSGRVYGKKRLRKLYRRLDDIPVLLPEGGILPLSAEDSGNGTANPRHMELCIGAGKDGSYTLYEDDGNSMDYRNGKSVFTEYKVVWNESGSIEIAIGEAKGETNLIPDRRDYKISIYGVEMRDDFKISGLPDGEASYEFDADRKIFTLFLGSVASCSGENLRVDGIVLAGNDHKKQVFDIIEYAWMDNLEKDIINNALLRYDDEEFLDWLKEADISEMLKDVISEVYCDRNIFLKG